jgi:hypothetical protein
VGDIGRPGSEPCARHRDFHAGHHGPAARTTSRGW